MPGQVAEIIVTLDGGAGRRGSGYRVGSGAALTAAHVIEDAVAVLSNRREGTLELTVPPPERDPGARAPDTAVSPWVTTYTGRCLLR